jgi:uncharacterized protein (DUF1697 family)
VPRHVAFLRAINVGGHIVKMGELRRHFEALDLANVETFIASGNVIFDTAARTPAALERKIEKHLLARLGYEVATFIRSPAELASVAKVPPYSARELGPPGFMLYIAFLGAKPSAEAVKKLAAFENDVDEFRVEGREVYWLCRKRFSESKFSGARLEKTLGMPATIRNVTTVRKIAALLSGA